MTTFTSDLRLQFFEDAPEFGKQFDLDSNRYSNIRVHP